MTAATEPEMMRIRPGGDRLPVRTITAEPPMSMRVLHVYKTYLPDNFQGIPRAIWEIAEGTFPLGVRSEVLSLSANPRPESVTVDHHVSRRAKQDLFIASTGLSLSAFARFRELARGADVIHYHFPWPMMDLLHFSVRFDRPAIVTYHSDIIRQRTMRLAYAPLMHTFLGSIDAIVATSPNYRDSSPVLRRHAGKVSVIPLGLGERPEVPAELLERWRQKLGRAPFFFYVGALRYYKGLPFLAEAARRTGLRVVVGGTGELEAELEGIRPPNFVMLGELDEADKEALLTLCQAFVFPSHLRSEAFGVSLLEAARAGKPMITCEIGTGTSYVNVHGETGLVVPPADADALGAAMQSMVTSPDAAVMGERARARYEALFTASQMARAYRALYDKVIRCSQ